MNTPKATFDLTVKLREVLAEAKDLQTRECALVGALIEVMWKDRMSEAEMLRFVAGAIRGAQSTLAAADTEAASRGRA